VSIYKLVKIKITIALLHFILPFLVIFFQFF